MHIAMGRRIITRQAKHKSRLTVTLAPGQREVLEKIAAHNGTTYAHVVRYAIKKFISENRSGQLDLDFPDK